MTKTTNLLRSSQKIFSTSSLAKRMQDKNNSDKNNNNNNNEYKIERKDTIERKTAKNHLKSSYKKLKTIKYSIKNNEERSNKTFYVIKELFDPEKYIVSEEELFRMGEGYCFGEWALIYKEPRAASIFTLEDCVFFTLDEIHFRNSFLKSLNNSEYSKKKFALQNFFPFDMTDERQLSIYKNIVPITCKRNQVVFNEGEISDSIFLIYLGSFTLEKKYGVKQYKVLNLERGSIVGLESIFEGEDSKYKCSLKLSHGLDVGLIFQLKINKLRPYIINKMKICFKINYSVFLKSWNDFFCKNVFIQQKMTNEKIGEFIGEKGKIEFENYLNENNNEQIEFNIDLINKINKNWKSVLDLEQEDKYEILFKDCLKKKFYNNYKKDGTLRIFSSRQRSKLYEPLNNNSNINKKKIINIIKNNIDNKNSKSSKSSNSFRNKNINNLTVNEISENIRKNKTLNALKNHLNLTEIKTNIALLDDDEEEENKTIDNNLLKKKLSKINDVMKLKTINNKYFLKSKNKKINKQLLYEQNIIKGNIPNNPKNNNEYITIHSNTNSILNNNHIFIPKNFKIINKLKSNLENEKCKDKDIINHIINSSKKNKEKVSINCNNNENILKHSNYSNLQKYIKNKNNLSRNNSDLFDNKNAYMEYNSFYNNLKSNSPIVINKNNKILFNKINPANSAQNRKSKQLSKIDSISEINLSQNKKFIYKDNINNKRNPSIDKRYFSSIILDKNNSKTIDIQNINKNNIFDNNLIKKIKYSNFTHRNKKSKSCFEENKNIYQELNLNNGFSVSYFKKINNIDNINNMKAMTKNKPFPSPLNHFKISFDSGLFKIPLISSNMKLTKV